MAALLKVAAVAERLGLSEYQARAEHARGVLPGRRVGRFLRFTEGDIETYLDRIREDRGSDASGLTAGSRRRRKAS